MNRRYWVYVHTCPNGKKYVGCTYQALSKRWLGGAGYWMVPEFRKDIKKFGWDNIKHEAWELTSESEMYYAEKYLIAYYQTTNPKKGYNKAEGRGSLGLNKPHSEETKKKISEGHKGKGHPHPKALYLLPDGTTKTLTIQNVYRHYLNKGISLTKIT